MELSAIFDRRRSIRSFTGEPISEQTMHKLLHAANASPVGRAMYDTVHLTIVKDKAILDALEQNAAEALHMEKRAFLYGVPELIIVSVTNGDNVGYSNAAIVAHDMSLAAVDAGVGVCHIWGCIVALGTNRTLIEKLGIPDGFIPACAVAVGKTDEVYTEREIPDDRISVNTI